MIREAIFFRRRHTKRLVDGGRRRFELEQDLAASVRRYRCG